MWPRRRLVLHSIAVIPPGERTEFDQCPYRSFIALMVKNGLDKWRSHTLDEVSVFEVISVGSASPNFWRPAPDRFVV